MQARGKVIGEACPRCGGTERYASRGACVACVAVNRQKHERKMRAELRRLREEANPKRDIA